MRVVIFAHGNFVKSKQIEKVLQKADMIVAADGGANTAVQLECIPDTVIGDFDSITPAVWKKLKTEKTHCISFEQEKDETDTELALDYAVKHGATEIVILGGNAGDRFDHIMANVLLAPTCPIPLRFITGNQISWIEKGPATCLVTGKKGDLLSLIPLREDVAGITTKNLYYPLQRGTLFFGKPRGISNVFLGKKAEVTFAQGTLLFVQTMV